MTDYNILQTINTPSDLKKLELSKLPELCTEIRHAILNRVSKIGGHVGPNLGIVELAVALHYVFESPKDKIIWDVSHQCYPHKILTGRKSAFMDDNKFQDSTGYTAPEESEHDIFTIGHTSTSISLAYGLARARNTIGNKENIIAVIGDGSLSGGEAFEGLDNAAELNSNFIIIINDNEMSIAQNHGGIYGNLAKLRASKGTASDNYFKAIGFEYTYVEEGNNAEKLIKVLQQAKDTPKPLVIHVHTLKGCGYRPATEDKERFHWTTPFDIQSGQDLTTSNEENYGSIIADYLDKKAEQDKQIMVINAATPGALCLKEYRSKHPEQYIDVGIAEEHAIAATSGMAHYGIKPVALFFGGFIQRAYDQVSQDLCLNKSPAVLIIEGTGISSSDITHLAIFDIPLLSNIPNLVCLAPSNKEETLRMLDWALEQKGFPVAIRTPWQTPANLQYPPKSGIKLGRSEITKRGEKIALFGLGSFLELAEKTAAVFEQKGFHPTIINPRFSNILDKEMLEELSQTHDTIITLEDGCLAGGFGEKIARFYGEKGLKTYCFGADKEFTNLVPLKELYHRYELTPEQIIQKVL